MPDTFDEFAELIDRIKQGDQQAMAELVDQYEPEVLAFSRAHLGVLLRPYLDSVDLVQSVHRSILVGLRNDKFDVSSPQKLIGLAFTMVRRKLARQWQRNRRQSRFDQADQSDDLSTLLAALSDEDSDPSHLAAIRDQIDRVLQACTQADRQLIRLRIEGFSTAEAARSLGLDPDISRVRLSRLRSRLQEQGVLADLL